MTDLSNYELTIVMGAVPDGVELPPSAVRFERPAGAPPKALASIAAKFKPADLLVRSVLVCFEVDAPGITADLAIFWVTLAGYGRRHVDVVLGTSGVPVPLSALYDRISRAAKDAPKPPTAVASLAVRGLAIDGAEAIDLDVPALAATANTGIITEQLVALRWATEVHLQATGSPARFLSEFVAVSAARLRNRDERFPIVTSDDGAQINLVAIWQSAGRERTLQRQSIGSLAARPAQSDRLDRLSMAAGVDVAAVLPLLGTHEHDGHWHCPRRHLHRNGDAKPSATIIENRLICQGPKCRMPVDALALTTELTGLGVDDACDLLLGELEWSLFPIEQGPCNVKRQPE